MTDKLKKIATEAFLTFKPLYPNYIQFLNKVKYDTSNQFVKENREFLETFYKSQEIVQIFQPPPVQEALKRKEGYYAKIISFYPFERLYTDTGKIVIYPYSLKEARATSKEKEKEPIEQIEPKEKTKQIQQESGIYETYDNILIPKMRYEGKGEKRKELSPEEYIKNLGKEKQFPPELRHVYLYSGKKKTGSQESNKMSEELKEKRKEYLEKNKDAS
jgi:hypothetical protein